MRGLEVAAGGSVSDGELCSVFKCFDADSDGAVSFDEFFVKIRVRAR